MPRVVYGSECWGRQRRSLTGWSGFSVLEALQGWAAYLRFGLPCVMMVCLEWWMWEVIVWLAGLLPSAEVAVAVTGISTQIQSLPWILCYSLGTATSTRVAQALGAGNARKAASLYRWAGVYVWQRPCGLHSSTREPQRTRAVHAH